MWIVLSLVAFIIATFEAWGAGELLNKPALAWAILGLAFLAAYFAFGNWPLNRPIIRTKNPPPAQ